MLSSTPPARKFVSLVSSGAGQAGDEPAGRHRGAETDVPVSVSALLAAAGLEPSRGRAARRRAMADAEVDVVVPAQVGAPHAEQMEDADTETLRAPRGSARLAVVATRPATQTPRDEAAAPAPAVVTRATWTPDDDDAAVTDLVARPGAEPGGGLVPGVLGLIVGLLALAGAVALAALPALGMLTQVTETVAALVTVVGVALLGGTCSAIGLAPSRRARPVAVLGLIASSLAVLMVALPILALHVL